MAYAVPGEKVLIAQSGPRTGWAAVYTMLRSWKHQASFDPEGLVLGLGGPFADHLVRGQALPPKLVRSFLQAAGMRSEPPRSLAVEAWEGLLRSHGLLWVETAADGSTAADLTSRVVEGIAGDGSLERTRFLVIDPVGGVRYEEPFSVFASRYEGAAQKTSGEEDFPLIRYLA